MGDTSPGQDWPGDWSAVSAEQRRAWRAASADERLRWLEEALTFALDSGALARERARRAAAARGWQTERP